MTRLPPRIDLPAEPDTEALGRRLAPILRTGEAICLSGGLGAGKSCLARALIRALTRPDEDAPSPTFTLVQTYASDPPIAHLDLYRLTGPDEVDELGLEELLLDGAVVIEWPDRLGARLPPDRLDIDLEEFGEGRRARLTPFGAFRGRRLEFRS